MKVSPYLVQDYEQIHQKHARRMRQFDSLPKAIREVLHGDHSLSLKNGLEIYRSCGGDVSYTVQELLRYATRKQARYEKGMWETGGRYFGPIKYRKGMKKDAASTDDLLA